MLAACGGAPTIEAPAATEADTVEAQAEPTAAAEAPEAPAATEESEPAPVEPTDAPTEVAAADTASNPSVSVAECQSVDIPDNPMLAMVTNADWVKGPADAPITLIEYGDFQ